MKRVLIVSGDSILTNGVKHIIKLHGGFDLRCIFNPNRDELDQEIIRFGPDVMILEQASLTGERNLLRILRARKKLSIILIDTQDNLLHVFIRDEIRISETNDLVEIIGRGFGLLGEIDLEPPLPVPMEKLPLRKIGEEASKQL